MALGVSGLCSLRGPPETLLGSAIWGNFQDRAASELIGQQAGSAGELALAAQVLRDPRFETMRVFFVKDGKIVGHTGWTSRLLGIAPIFPKGLGTQQFMEHLRSQT